MQPRILEVRTRILKENDERARALRAEFLDAGVLVVNVVSSPGSGKTQLLQRTMTILREQGHAVAAIVGDLETDRDAQRLAKSGAPVRQIMTHGCCHLEADMVKQQLTGWGLSELDFLFIENVGNLVCPTSWDLGEGLRVAMLSVTEGEDKPLKYPGLFNTSDMAIVTKMDLAEVCEFDRAAALQSLQQVRPGIQVLETSAKTGQGVDQWIEFLKNRRCEQLAT
ncbi:MAG: hydrogenase nickel incorporation protein HypB [Planctomycetales bacterium]|nr:hydrogenase nickel incorporation protein HypB [Planctomycetales bacterium]